MYCIYIMDRDKRFAARLGHALSKRCPKYRFLSVSNPDELKSFQEKLGQLADLLVYTIDQFPTWEVPDQLNLLKLRDKPSLQELYGNSVANTISEAAADYAVDASDGDDDGEPGLYRFAGVNVIAQEIQQALSGHVQSEDEPVLKTVLLYTPSPGLEANRIWERLLARELDKGRRAVGLPLASPHLFSAPALLLTHPVADRADLSMLLLRLEYDEIDAKTVLPYFIPTGQGCLAMAASTGIDDINEIKSDVLVKLLKLTQEALAQSNEATTLFVLTAGLSVSRVRSLLPHCSEFMTASDPNIIESHAWQHVLNELLNSMKSKQKHQELWEAFEHGID